MERLGISEKKKGDFKILVEENWGKRETFAKFILRAWVNFGRQEKGNHRKHNL